MTPSKHCYKIAPSCGIFTTLEYIRTILMKGTVNHGFS